MTSSVIGSTMFRQSVVRWVVAGTVMLVLGVVGCGGDVTSQDDDDRTTLVQAQSDEIEQIASAVETALDEAELGPWRVTEPVTFRHGVSAANRSARVATISFTCMFPVTIRASEHENLVRHNGRLVYHQGQWHLQQVAVAFKFFNEDEFTDETDLLATSLVDGGKLAVLKTVWETTVRDTVEIQLAQKQLEEAEAEKAEEEAAALKQAEADAEAEAKRARADAVTRAARLVVMKARLSKIAKAANSDFGATVEGVDGLRFTGRAEVDVELVENRYHGKVSFQATPRNVTTKYTAVQFGRPWIYVGLESDGGWGAASRRALKAFLDKWLADSKADGK